MAKTPFSYIPLLMGILLISACQPSTPGLTPSAIPITAISRPRPTATPIPISTLDVEEDDLKGIEIEVWHPWFGAPAALFDLQVEEFNKENPWGITVSAAYQGSYNMLFNMVTDALDTPQGPDVVVALSEQISVWDEADSITDLAPYITDPIWGMTVIEQADFPRIFIEQDQRETTWLALPAQRTSQFLIYNQSWGEELGFDAPPLKFEEFEEQACAANQFMRSDDDLDNDGKGGWIVDFDSSGVLSWMVGFEGGPFVNEEYQFISSQNINAFSGLKKLYDNQCAWLSTAETPYEQFAGRSALFITASMEEFDEISRSFLTLGSHDEWTVIPFPGEKKGALVVYGSSFAILETDDAEALASWLFVKWMLEPHNQTRWVKSTALFPLRESSLDELAEYKKGHPQWAEAVDLISQAEIQPKLPSWHRVRYLLGDGFEYIYRFDSGAGSVAAILAHMNEAARALSD